MKLHALAAFCAAALAAASIVHAQAAPPVPPAAARQQSEFQTSTYTPTAQEYAAMKARLAELNAAIADLKKSGANADLVVDAESCAWQAYNMISVPGAFIDQSYVGKCTKVISDGLRRAQQIKAGTAAWPQIRGAQVNLAYRSKVDGTCQPYQLSVPASYDPSKPTALYVYLHGRSHIVPDLGEGWAGGNDNAGGRGGGGGGANYIKVNAFGRANNSFVWAGETDVLEVIASLRHRFNIDPNRILLSGFSLGGAGAWQTGLHYPDMFCGLEVDAGVIGNRVNLDGLDAVQRATTANYGIMIDHAINVLNVPLVAYAGANDAQLASSQAIRKQLTTLGYTIDQTSQYVATGKDINVLFLANPGQGHSHATGATAQLVNAFNAQNFKTGRIVPDNIKYVTYTTRYNHDFWITVDGMSEEFSRAYVDARRDAAKANYTIKTQNVSRLILDDMNAARSISIDGDTMAVTAAPSIHLVRDASGGHWKAVSGFDAAGLHKQHGLQGPLNDAFMDAFICVSPTGTPFSASNEALAKKELARFEGSFLFDYLGDTRTRSDTAVTDADIANNNLILFGDPGSNTLIARILDKLPIKWTKDSLVVAGKTYNTADSMPVMIYPNPLNPNRYVVINAGLSAPGRSSAAYADWAVLKSGAVVAGGVFDGAWKLPAEN